MKIHDLFNMCIHNLLRHKSRTILTILGVIIGCCSVVIMISFGIGMKISQESMLAEMGDLQVIDIYNSGNKIKITDSIVENIKNIPNVISVNPCKSFSPATKISAGPNNRYQANWTSILGLKPEAIEDFNYEIIEGTGLSGKSTGNTLEALAGEYFAYTLNDTQKPEGYNYIDYWSYLYGDNDGADESEMPDPYVKPLDNTFELTVGNADSTNEKTITKKIKIVGVLKQDYSKGYETAEGLILNVKDLQKLEDEYNRLNNIVSRESQSYSNGQVKVSDIKKVAEVEKQIQELGLSTSSLESIREPLEKEVRQKQLMFAGLGIVSLFVAALGIMNTMFMAISERKKEIGLMKALGCPVNAVRAMFLMEAGSIGFIGGILGAIISLLVSCGINIVSSGMLSSGEIFSDISSLISVLFVNTDRVSVIPVWLTLSAIIFSVFVGVLSGYWPANSAVKISALDAIRSE